MRPKKTHFTIAIEVENDYRLCKTYMKKITRFY